MGLWFVSLLLSASIFAQTDNRRVLKEAENFTLLQDRASACGVIYKAYKKSSGSSAAQLKEKLFYFSKYFYTEKGLQNYSEGKELFAKEKYAEAQEKFAEADEVEKNNVDVLRKLALSNMWNKKQRLALENNAKARLINPLDTELVRDKLAIEFNGGEWKDALVTVEQLKAIYKDTTALTQYMKAVALLKTDQKEAAEEAFKSARSKDKKYPEIFYWLSEQEEESALKQKLLLKYAELCKNKKLIQNERDMSLCTRAPLK